MVMIECFNGNNEKGRHQSAIQMLARDLKVPAKEIEAIYQQILEEFKRTARVKDFLFILVSRQVKDLFRNKRAA